MDDMLFVAKRKAEDARVRGGVYSHYISWMICCVSPSASKAEDAMRGHPRRGGVYSHYIFWREPAKQNRGGAMCQCRTLTMVLYGIGCHRTTPTPHSRKHQRPRPTDEAPLFRFSNYCIRKDMQAGVLTY